MLGVTQSVADPCLFSLVADYFPGDKIAKANGILMGGAYIGAGLSALNVILINAFGWRGCLKTIGLFGFAIAAASLLLVREPVRDQFKKYDRQQRELKTGIKEEEEPLVEDNENILTSFKNSLVEILQNPVSRYCTFAGMFRIFGMFACDYYIPAFFLSNYPSYGT